MRKIKKELLGAEGASDSFLLLLLISAFITHFCIFSWWRILGWVVADSRVGGGGF
jgi:hypothetical protein